MPQTIDSVVLGVDALPVSKTTRRPRGRLRAPRTILNSAFLKLFFLLDRAGVHVLPKHYYAPMPDYAWLQENKALWTRRTDLTGVEWDLDKQFQWLQQTCEPYLHEVVGLRVYEEVAQSGWGQGYGPIESQVLHCFVRSHAPRRVIEIGSGVSTACLLHASRINRIQGSPEPEITCVEPYPKKAFHRLQDIVHIRQICQAVPEDVFRQLGSGDLLFIDSSHSVKIGSDVMRIYLEIIPSLPPGVFIHIHDICLPYIYPRSALHIFFGWQETALLLALLKHNPRLRVLSCLSALHYDRTGGLRNLFDDYRPQENEEGLRSRRFQPGHFPSSIWLETC